MPVPSSIADLSTTAASNSPSGSESRSTSDDYHRQTQAMLKGAVSQGADIASASTLALPATGAYFDVTGTTTVSAISSTNSWDGRVVTLQFDGVLTLTHSSSLNLGGSNIVTAAGRKLKFVQVSSGVWDLLDKPMRVNVMEYGAKGDGSTNDKAAIIAAITAAGSGGHVYLPMPTSFYSINGPITLNVANQIFEMARGATIKIANATNDNVLYVTANGVRVTGGILDGNRTNQTREQTGNAGIALSGVSNVQVDNVEVKNTAGPGIVLASLADVRVLNNYIHETDMASIYSFGSSSMPDWLVQGNTCVRVNDTTQADSSCISLIGSSTNPLTQVRVIANYCAMPTGAFSASSAGGITVRGQWATVSHNNITGGLTGISLDGFQSESSYMACVGNTINQAGNYGVEIGGVGYCSISSNIVVGATVTTIGMILDTDLATNYNVIANNVFTNLSSEAISCQPGGSNSESVTVVTGNVIQGAPLGVRIQQSTNWIVNNNYYIGDSSSAFVLATSNASGTIGQITVNGNQVSNATAVLEHNAATAITANNLIVQGNIYTGGAHIKKSGSALLGGSVSATRGAAGNIAAPSVPATTVSTQNPALSDATIYLTAGSSTCTVAIEGVTAYVVPSSGVASFRLLAGQSVTLTYTNAPTWKWFLD